jgi:hypothetical protein
MRPIKGSLEQGRGVADVSLVRPYQTLLGRGGHYSGKTDETDGIVASVAIVSVRIVRCEYCGHRAALISW